MLFKMIAYSFQIFLSGANTYLWTFGDNDSSNLFAPYHHYSNGGAIYYYAESKK
jgi:hypothetical protein